MSSKRILSSIFPSCLVLVYLVLGPHALYAASKPISITVDRSKIFTTTTSSGQPVHCALWNGTYRPGIPKGNSKFILFSKKRAALKALLAKVSDAKKPVFTKRLKAINSKIRAQSPICKDGPPPPAARTFSVSCPELGSINISLGSSENTAKPVTYIVTTEPKFGRLEGTPPDLLYIGGHRDDSFGYKISNGISASAEGTISVTIARSSSQLSGDPESLSAYRDQLTETEVRQLLKNVALGGSEQLVQYGLQNGLDALIERLLSVQDDSEAERKAEKLALDSAGLWMIEGAQNYWLALMLKSNNPAQYAVSYHLHNWFPPDLSPYSRSTISDVLIKNHLDYLRRNAFGNFEEFVRQTAFQATSVIFLDNRQNSIDGPNQNYARELLELLTLGSVDNFSGTPNYTEKDIEEVTAAVAGYYDDYASGPKTIIRFAQSRWDPREKTIFAGTAWEETARFDHDSLVHHILYRHPQAARYIAARFFTLLVHVNPSTALVDKLAAELRDTHSYELKPFLATLFKSSAMFSSRDKLGIDCVSSPLDVYITFLRTTNYPIREQLESDGVMRFYSGQLSALSDQLVRGNQNIFQLRNIFGSEDCGVNRDTVVNNGSIWLGSQGLLERTRGLNRLLNALLPSEVTSYVQALLPTQNASAVEVLTHFEKILGISLQRTEAQHQKALECLTTLRPGETGTAWDPTNLNKLKIRIGCLLEAGFNSLDFQKK